MYDGDEALQHRLGHQANQGCNENVMQIIQNVMLQVNPYAAAFKHMAEVEAEEINFAALENRPMSETVMYMKRGKDTRRYNLPQHEEVAMIFIGNDGAPPLPSERDVVIYPRKTFDRYIYSFC